ncbi:TPA: GlsB/YeaQ/YmgE family stress response membrane protein [Photobacterium damselae]
MGIISWIILGLIAGAFAGGWLGSFIGLGNATGVNISSIVTATLGAFILLFIYNRFIR